MAWRIRAKERTQLSTDPEPGFPGQTVSTSEQKVALKKRKSKKIELENKKGELHPVFFDSLVSRWEKNT